MLKKYVAVGIIHARGGSKRIPSKNIMELAGKPLLAWMVDAALGAQTLDRVIVSTDHEGIAQVAREYGAEVPFKRPVEISEDVPSELVTQHAVRYLEEEEHFRVDIAVTLQPTTPFCLSEDIDASVNKLIATGADSVISVCEVRERPEWMFKLEGDKAISFMDLVLEGDVGVSQNLPKLYVPNGGIYATRRDVLMEQGAIIGKNTRAVIMPLERSLDIDEPVDFVLAEVIALQLDSDQPIGHSQGGECR